MNDFEENDEIIASAVEDVMRCPEGDDLDPQRKKWAEELFKDISNKTA